MPDWISPLTEDEKRRRKLAAGDVLEDGEYARFNIMMMDSGRHMPAAASLASQLASVEAQRRRWLADKQLAHRASRSQPGPVALADAAPQRAAPTPTGRDGIRSARAAWLADKAGAYRTDRGEA